MDDIDRFEGTEVVTVDGSSRDGDDVIVHTTLVTASREHVPMDYRVHGAAAKLQRRRHQHRRGQPREPLSNDLLRVPLANMSIDQLIDRLQRQLPAAVKTK